MHKYKSKNDVFGHHTKVPSSADINSLQTKEKLRSPNKGKYLLAGATLLLMVVAGGVAYKLTQQQGVGDIRQQASEKDSNLFQDSLASMVTINEHSSENTFETNKIVVKNKN